MSLSFVSIQYQAMEKPYQDHNDISGNHLQTNQGNEFVYTSF